MSYSLQSALAAQSQHLAEFAGGGTASAKPVLLRITSDLFVCKLHHSPDEIAQFQEMVLQLIGGTDDAALKPIAEKLARHGGAPAAVMQAMIRRGGTVAATIFEFSPALDRATLLDVAKWGDFGLAMAIARRPIFDDQLTRFLAERPEEEVAVTLLQNPATSFEQSTIAYLMRRARKNPMIAQALASREDIAVDFAPLFLWAPAKARADIILAARRMDLGEFGRIRLTGEEAAAHLKLERLALARETPAFEEALASQLSCHQDVVDLLMQDETGESLAIALAAIGMPADTAARIFMTVDPVIAHSVERVRKLTELVRVLSRRAASRLAQVILGLKPAQTPPRQPVEVSAAHPLASRAAEMGTALPRPASAPAPLQLRTA